jgi:hypothetical protein
MVYPSDKGIREDRGQCECNPNLNVPLVSVSHSKSTRNLPLANGTYGKCFSPLYTARQIHSDAMTVIQMSGKNTRTGWSPVITTCTAGKAVISCFCHTKTRESTRKVNISKSSC